MGKRATTAILSSLKELKVRAGKLKQVECRQQVSVDIAAFNDLDKFLRAIREVGFHLKDLRANKMATFLRAYRQAAVHDQWLRRFGVDLVKAYHAYTTQHYIDTEFHKGGRVGQHGKSLYGTSLSLYGTNT